MQNLGIMLNEKFSLLIFLTARQRKALYFITKLQMIIFFDFLGFD